MTDTTNSPAAQPQGVEPVTETLAQRLFNAWWRVNHPWDWWAKDRNGQPLPSNDRMMIADLCRRAFYAGEIIANTDTAHAGLPRATSNATKWDKSGLREACERGLKMGRTRQEFDIQLLHDMLLEIERLEATPRASGETAVEACLTELRELFPNASFLSVKEHAIYQPSMGHLPNQADVQIEDKGFRRATLADCMAQVRAATRTEGEGEKQL